MTVFIVYYQKYRDDFYHEYAESKILGVFTLRDKAEKFKDSYKINLGDEIYIKEWIVE